MDRDSFRLCRPPVAQTATEIQKNNVPEQLRENANQKIQRLTQQLTSTKEATSPIAPKVPNEKNAEESGKASEFAGSLTTLKMAGTKIDNYLLNRTNGLELA